MAKLTDSQKLAVVAGVTVALSGIGGGGVWWGKGLVEEKATQISQMKEEIREAKTKIQRIPSVENAVVILRENLSHYVKILPDAKELNNFVRVTNDFISQSGVYVSQFQPGRQGDGGKKAFSRHSYKFEIKATLWRFMQFMSFFESYERFVQIKEFGLKSGGGREAYRGGQDAVHTIGMTVETFVYTGTGSSEGVRIPSYDKKVERLREKIFEARQEMALVGYKFMGPRGRRDIFLDPRQDTTQGLTGPGGLSPQEQRKIIDVMKTKIIRCREIGIRLQDKSITVFDKYSLLRQMLEQVDAIENRVEEVSAKNLVSHAPLKLLWTREAVEPVRELRRLASRLKGLKKKDQWLSEEQMKSLVVRMTSDLTSGNMDSAIESYEAVEAKLAVPKDDPRYSLRLRVEDFHMRAQVAQDFSALRLDISGICVNEAGRSALILNGISYEEGESVDGDLMIKDVDRDRVEFVYRGFTIVRTL